MKPFFSGSRISTVESLASALRINSADLKAMAGSASRLYSDFEILKRDGSPRFVAGPYQNLKIIQKRINRQILERVDYPPYLFGGLAERNYVQNAQVHSGARVVIALDVRDFYQSIRKPAVFELFKYFFCFSNEVAEVLTNLCTRGGSVPQGACTSSFLANLIFYKLEHRLVLSLADQGLRYTRLIDDISISSPQPVSKSRSEMLIKQVAAMLKVGGFKLKNKKTRVTSDSNPEELMLVTGLWLNRGAPRVSREERQDIRLEVRKCTLNSRVERISEEFHELHSRVSGRVAKLAHLKHPESKRFRGFLRLCMPIYGKADIARTEALILGMGKTPLSTRATLSYITKYYQALHRVNIIGRTQVNLCERLRKHMWKLRPAKRKDAVIHGY